VCRAEGTSLLAYSPLAGGVLSGKYQDGAWPPGARFTRYKDGSPRTQSMTRRFVSERTLAATARFAELAKEHGVALATFAVAWTLAHDFLGATIVGATSVAQLHETLAAAEGTLSQEALEAVDRISKEIRQPMG
jgi:aryl-alcohol dehydrogenase-like predicted oxidoreductase